MAQKSEHCYAGMDTDYEPKDPSEDCVPWEDLLDTLFIQPSGECQCGGVGHQHHASQRCLSSAGRGDGSRAGILTIHAGEGRLKKQKSVSSA